MKMTNNRNQVRMTKRKTREIHKNKKRKAERKNLMKKLFFISTFSFNFVFLLFLTLVCLRRRKKGKQTSIDIYKVCEMW